MLSFYGSMLNVIYEIVNELNGDVNWKCDIKLYVEEVIFVICKNDFDNIIIVGIGIWSQDVNDVVDDQLKDVNVMYVFYFYVGIYGQFLWDKVNYVFSKGVFIFVMEWGISDVFGNGGVFFDQLWEWLNYFNSKNISWVNWNFFDKQELFLVLKSGVFKIGGWLLLDLFVLGMFVRENIFSIKNLMKDSFEMLI